MLDETDPAEVAAAKLAADQAKLEKKKAGKEKKKGGGGKKKKKGHGASGKNGGGGKSDDDDGEGGGGGGAGGADVADGKGGKDKPGKKISNPSKASLWLWLCLWWHGGDARRGPGWEEGGWPAPSLLSSSPPLHDPRLHDSLFTLTHSSL